MRSVEVRRIVALLIATPTAVIAQKPDTLPKDTVTLTPVVVNATRLPAVRDVVRGLTGRTATLEGSDLDARGVRTLADALDELPGVTTSDELGAAAQLDVTVRGFQVSPTVGLPQGITVYVDGVRVNEPDANEVNFDVLPLEDVERVEVIYGPSVLFGRNSLGAAVNLVTHRGEKPGFRAGEISGGSYGRYEAKFQAGDRRGIWDYYIGARYEHEDGWRQKTQSRIGTVFAKLGLLTATWDATLSYSGAANKIFQAGSLPEDVVATRPDSNFSSDYFAPLSHLVTLNAQRKVGAAQLALNLFGRTLVTDQFNGNADPPDSRQRNHERIGGGAVQLTGRARFAGRPLRWFGGADGDYSHTVVGLYAVPASGGDSLSDSVRAKQVNLGAFAGASWEFASAFAATLVARYDYIRLPYEDLLEPDQNGVNTFRRVSPRLGLSWTGLTNHEVYASASRGFRAPALIEIACSDPAAACPLPFALGADPPLKPVVATTYELGWHTRQPVAGWTAGADVYKTDVRDDIFFVAPTPTTGYFQNIAATRRAGFEASLRWVSAAGAQVYVNYGYTRATFETTAVLSTGREPGNETVMPGDRMPMIPSHRVNAGVAVPAFKDRLRFRADARYVGAQFLRGDEENVETRLPDYGVADISAEATLGRYELRLMMPNVLNTKYTTFGTFAENPTEPGSPVQRFLTPGQPRHVLASVSVKF